MIEIDDVGEARTEEIVEWMDDHPVVRTVDLLRHGDGTGLVSFQTDYSDTDTEPVGTVFREQPCIPLSRAEVRNGFEHCHIMMANTKQIRTTYDELRDYGPVEVRSFSELDSTVRADDLAGVSRAVSGLSTRQQQVLERAIQRGLLRGPPGLQGRGPRSGGIRDDVDGCRAPPPRRAEDPDRRRAAPVGRGRLRWP
jgi:hypothetical protein